MFEAIILYALTEPANADEVPQLIKELNIIIL